jgi:hypothetical protein
MRRQLGILGLVGVLLSGTAVAAHAAEGDRLNKLRTLKLAVPDDGASGTLTFDGRALYYAPQTGGDQSTVYRMSPVNGRELEEVQIDVPNLDALTYDGRRNRLYAVGRIQSNTIISVDASPAAMYDVDPATGEAEKMFDIQNYGNTHYSFDATLDAFRVISEGPFTLKTVDLGGDEVASCEIEDVPESASGPSTLAAAGDGQVYIQLEDDTTIIKVDANCAVTDSGIHDKYSEASENDAMVCDTVTFGVPAVWIRDGQLNAVSAYEVPSGYCPLPTALTPVRSSTATVSRGRQTLLCTRLSLPGHQLNLPGQLVTISVDNSPIGKGRTDRNGVLCLPYTPEQSGKRRLAAAFGGTLAYLPSHAVGVLSVQTAAPAPAGPRAAAPREEAATSGRPATQPQAQPVPQSAVQAAPAPAAQAASQAQAQAQAQTQVQAQVQQQIQVVAVPQVQEQLQLAWVDERGDLSMTRFQPTRPRHDLPLPHALAVLALGGACCALAGRAVVVHARAD